jgi:hypothetical protein
MGFDFRQQGSRLARTRVLAAEKALAQRGRVAQQVDAFGTARWVGDEQLSQRQLRSRRKWMRAVSGGRSARNASSEARSSVSASPGRAPSINASPRK